MGYMKYVYALFTMVMALVCMFSIPANVGLLGMLTPLTLVTAVLAFYFLHKVYEAYKAEGQ